jgi:hypothetical protein
MAWSFLEKFPNVQSARFIQREIHRREREKDLEEQWPKCLAATDGNVEKAKDRFVDFVLNKPAWLEIGLSPHPPERARIIRRYINVLKPPTSAHPSPTTASSSGIMANLNIESTVPGADIEIDGAFVGNTPSTIVVAPGNHQIAVKKKGFTGWNRTLNVTGGTVHLSAELEPENPIQ